MRSGGHILVRMGPPAASTGCSYLVRNRYRLVAAHPIAVRAARTNSTVEPPSETVTGLTGNAGRGSALRMMGLLVFGLITKFVTNATYSINNYSTSFSKYV